MSADTADAAGVRPPLGNGPAAVPATIGAAARARALREAGHDVISLALGEPDFPPPAHVLDALDRAARAGATGYPPIRGTAALHHALRRKWARENGLSVAADEVIVTNGAKQAIHEAFAATLRPGDRVLVPRPYWASYPLIAAMLGGAAETVACRAADGFRLDPDALARAIGPRTRWLVLNFPNNPTGAGCDPDRLRAIAAVIRRHPDLWVLSDEIYEHLVHAGGVHPSLAALAPELRSQILTVNGVAKSYAMPGFRIGYAAGPARLIAAMAAVQGNVTSGANAPGQAAAVAALDGPQDERGRMRDAFRRRRDTMLAVLADLPELACARPDGAFYLFPSIAGLLGRCSANGVLLATDDDVATSLLEEAHLATVAGSAFGAPGHLRLSIAAGDDALAEAARRLRRFCAGCA